MEKFDINKYDINKNYAIEASAGTGKTYNIVEIVKKLVDNEIDFSKIVIVTYTEKAAGELKDRIRKEVKGIDIDSGFIGTIHSFCQQLINEFALSAGFALDLSMQSQQQFDDFINRYIRKKEIIAEIALINGEFNAEKFGEKLKYLVNSFYLDADNQVDETIVSIDDRPSKNDIEEKRMAYKYVEDCYKCWQQEKKQKRIQNYDDMIRNVREALLHKTAFANSVREKYTYGIIDEFQDTNQKQFDIFKQIFLQDDDHHIIVVGDPKQSIYSFQQADINVYFSAVNEIVAANGEKCVLKKNYRSTEKMVRACNALFPNFKFEQTEFIECDYKNTADKDENIAECYYQGKETEAFWITESLDEGKFAHIAVEVIVDICTMENNGETRLRFKDGSKVRNVKFSDIAILARSKSEMEPIAEELRKAGIPFVRYKDNSLFSSLENAHWISLLQAINAYDFTGSNRSYFKKALTTKFFGYSLQQAANEKFDRDDTDEMLLLNRYRQEAKEGRWQDLIDDILLNSNISKNMSSLESMQSYAIFRQIGDYCIEYLSQKASLTELINNLKQNGKDDDDTDGINLVEKSTDFNCVKIMTIHASKGLEFPVVISVAGFKEFPKSNKIYSYRKTSGGKSNPVISLDKDSDQVNLEQYQELKRLFYVAYTRAKYLLVLPYYEKFIKVSKKFDDFLTNSICKFVRNERELYRLITDKSTDYQTLRKQVSEILISEPKQTCNLSFDKQEGILKQLIGQIKSNRVQMYSYSSLSHPIQQIEDGENSVTNSNGIVVDSDENIEGLAKYDRKKVVAQVKYVLNQNPVSFPPDFPKGAAVGTAMHEIFEQLDFTKYQDNLTRVIKACFTAQQIVYDDNWSVVLQEMVDNVLNSDIPVFSGGEYKGETIRLAKISNNNKRAECEFNVRLQSEQLKNYFNGFIDLLVQVDDRVLIIDWKSDSLNQQFNSYSDLKQLEKHVDDSYSIQRTLYGYYLIEALAEKYPQETKSEIFQKHFAGVCYVFLRGAVKDTSNGIYCQSWNSYDDLKNSFEEIIQDKVKQ
ncbi:MAG: UvrD-helicase domain-containing protein [Erysipelotrichaceae bacterium]